MKPRLLILSIIVAVWILPLTVDQTLAQDPAVISRPIPFPPPFQVGTFKAVPVQLNQTFKLFRLNTVTGQIWYGGPGPAQSWQIATTLVPSPFDTTIPVFFGVGRYDLRPSVDAQSGILATLIDTATGRTWYLVQQGIQYFLTPLSG